MRKKIFVSLCTIIFAFMSNQNSSVAKSSPIELVSEITQLLDSCDLSPDRNVKVRNTKFDEVEAVGSYKLNSAIKFIDSKGFQIELIIYEFKSPIKSKEAFENFRVNKYLDTVFKEYNFLFTSASNLVLIRSGCNQVKKRWDNVIKRIKSSQVLDDKKYIECSCGGNCKFP